MRSKIITSLIAGLALPWFYFVVFTVGSVVTFSPEGERIIGKSGIAGFVQFHGVSGAFLIYLKATAVCTGLAFSVLLLEALVRRALASKP